MLQLFDLVQVVNEGLRNLFNKQWSISNLELNFLLRTIVALCILAHLFLGDDFGDLAGPLQCSCIANESRRALDSLL